LDQIRVKKAEFDAIDMNGDGVLELHEVEAAARKRCNLNPSDPMPQHLLDHHWKRADLNGDGEVTFEEYVMWSINVDSVSSDPSEPRLRRVSQHYGFHPWDVEKIKAVFDGFDEDASGAIDKDEFMKALRKLMHLGEHGHIAPSQFERYWLEADADRNGEISFEEFMLWYFNVMGGFPGSG